MLLVIASSRINIFSQNDYTDPKEVEKIRFDYNNLSFRAYMRERIILNSELIHNDNNGVLLTGMKLSAEGNILDVFTLNSINPEIDSIILDIIETSEEFWTPIPGSVEIRNDILLILPIIFIPRIDYSEYHVDRNNFRLKLLDELFVASIGYSIPAIRKTSFILKKVNSYTSREKYEKASPLIDELIRRDPLNTDYYIIKIKNDKMSGNTASACANLKFVNYYLVRQPDEELIKMIECE